MQAETTHRYAVVAHSSGADRGGYVVRTMYGDYLPAPYTRADAIAVYEDRDEAEAHADSLYEQLVAAS